MDATAQAPSPRLPQSIRSGASSSLRAAPPLDRVVKQVTGTAPTLAQRLLSPSSATPLFPLTTPDHVILNDQIYKFLALALRAFVLTWWSKLSPKDKEFLPQITKVVQHVVKETRGRVEADGEDRLAGALLAGIPALVQQHYTDFRSAKSKIGTSYGSAGDLVKVFHRLQPHIAVRVEDEQGAPIGVESALDPVYLGAAIDLVLKASLPPEESGSDMERHIVREIIVGPVLCGALPRVVQPWFIHKAMLDLLGPPNKLDERPLSSKSSPFTFHSITVIFLTAVQAISTFFLRVINLSQSMVNLANDLKSPERDLPITSRSEAIKELFFSSSRKRNPTKNDQLLPQCGLSYPALSMVKEILDLRCNPGSNLVAAAAFNSIELTAGLLEPFLDRYLPYALKTKVFTPRTFSSVVVAGTNNLFPESNNGYPGPPPETPSLVEQAMLREKLEMRLKEVLPYPLSSQATTSLILDPLSSPECNMHLMILIIDLVLVTLFPEIAVSNS
ncbi:hypothetical protein FRC04_001491 [Tulasnella sp. 424]|nr:hypothetical protein FRC04_001491 [Tulasnella sp. 424]KAG8974548.1 hypothetical protein FRC05_007180 [Tulasnella sp. 425]